MNPVAFIEDRRDGKGSTPREITEFVRMAQGGEIPDYQVAAWLMAVFFRGMTRCEVRAFTEALSLSGKVVTFPWGYLPGGQAQTGGVGDKTSLVVVPWLPPAVSSWPSSAAGASAHRGRSINSESTRFFRPPRPGQFVEQVKGRLRQRHSEDLAPAEPFTS